MENSPYAGRPKNSIPINLSFDRETALLLNELAPTKKARSAFLGRLLHAHKARLEAQAAKHERLQPLSAETNMDYEE
jgi:hypothetical protein